MNLRYPTRLARTDTEEDVVRDSWLRWLTALGLGMMVLLTGCAESHVANPDASWPDALAPLLIADVGSAAASDSAMCGFPDGFASCDRGLNIVVCCGGSVVSAGADGPCFPSPPDDGAVPACDTGDWPGCPCEVEGSVSCDFPFDRWRRECVGGVWVERTNQWCCPER